MSLTSYRAAPPRDTKRAPSALYRLRRRRRSEGGVSKGVLGRPGSDRLSRGLGRSTMGAGGFNGRVRNGIGWNSPARTTRPAKDADTQLSGIGYQRSVQQKY